MRLILGREKDFQQLVVDFARLNNWLVYFTWRSIHSPAGFPDCVFVRPADAGLVWLEKPGTWNPARPGLIFAELKIGRNQPTAEQLVWLTSLQFAGIPAYLWTPDNWDEIQRVLALPPVSDGEGGG